MTNLLILVVFGIINVVISTVDLDAEYDTYAEDVHKFLDEASAT